MTLEYVKKETDNYLTIRQVINEEFKISYTLLLKLKKNNRIFLNGENTYLDSKLCIGDKLLVLLDFDEDSSNVVATKMDLDILFEDDSMLILNKPAGLPVHPSVLHFENSLSNGVKYYFDSINLHRKIRPVNRLDRNTSGIVVFAKNEYIHSLLSSQMQKKIFKKEYIAICEGIFDKNVGTINVPIARKEGSIIERCVDSSGDSSVTHYKVIKEYSVPVINGESEQIYINIIQNKSTSFLKLSELQINLETGRTHQIRVHMAYLGHPILGDSLYGKASTLINRQALHAFKIKFIHPITKSKIVIDCPLPNDIQKVLSNIYCTK